MNIPRLLQQKIEKQLGKQKVILLYGTRRAGKTTIIENIAEKYKDDVLMLQGEDMQVSAMLQQRTIANYKKLTRGKKIIIIDEGQAVPEIGQALKLMIDNIKGITIIVTGNIGFDLAKEIGVLLLRSSVFYHIFPLAQAEISLVENRIVTSSNLEQRLIYGSYPEILKLNGDQERSDYLTLIVNSYKARYLNVPGNTIGADILYKLLQLLAWQVGRQVSNVELGNSLQLNKITVERYLDLLTKVFIIYPLNGYSNNLRKEVTKSKKWYFYDNGIRNALISNFSPLHGRDDIGQLWEQYVLSERMKYNSYRGYQPEYFFWRTYDGQKIDLLEMNNRRLQAIECKWQKGKAKVPIAFAKAYPDAAFNIVDQDSYLEWIS